MIPPENHEPEQPQAGHADARQSSKRFRFKRKRHDSDDHEKDRYREEHRRRHRDSHRRSKKRKDRPQPIDDPSAYDDSFSGLPPDTAFRESLFDAMADDEGAAFWEGVYGQPIHGYRDTYQGDRIGELESMNDEEYAQFVRQKMWEKSWEGIEAAKEEKIREREREKQKIREEQRSEHYRDIPGHQADDLFDLDVERSLRRGEQRRDRKHWKCIWEQYLQKWEELEAAREAQSGRDHEPQLFLRNKIAWPVESGKRKDISYEEVERFFKRCTDTLDGGDATLNRTLKLERVRWHPDKIQQRYGFMGIDDNTTQGVTAVFQALDRVWSNYRGNG